MAQNENRENKNTSGALISFLALVAVVSLGYALYEHNQYMQLMAQTGYTPDNSNVSALSPSAGGNEANSTAASPAGAPDNSQNTTQTGTGSANAPMNNAPAPTGSSMDSSGTSGTADTSGSGGTMSPDNSAAR